MKMEAIRPEAASSSDMSELEGGEDASDVVKRSAREGPEAGKVEE